MRAAAIMTGWVFLSAAMPALAQSPVPPSEEIAVVRARNQAIVSNVQAAAGVFSVTDDGGIRHLQSGLVCPASFPSAQLSQVMVYKSAELGADVGCDYRRADDNGGASAKFSIFATKAGADTTLDSAFAGYQREVRQANANVRPLGPALKTDSQMPVDFRSEEYLVTWNERDYTSDLIVAIKAGWVIEVRGTFIGQPNGIELSKEGGSKAAATAMQDRITPFYAFIRALGGVGSGGAIPAPR